MLQLSLLAGTLERSDLASMQWALVVGYAFHLALGVPSMRCAVAFSSDPLIMKRNSFTGTLLSADRSSRANYEARDTVRSAPAFGLVSQPAGRCFVCKNRHLSAALRVT